MSRFNTDWGKIREMEYKNLAEMRKKGIINCKADQLYLQTKKQG